MRVSGSVPLPFRHQSRTDTGRDSGRTAPQTSPLTPQSTSQPAVPSFHLMPSAPGIPPVSPPVKTLRCFTQV